MTKKIVTHTFYYLLLIIASIFFLLPIYLMVLTSIKPFNEVGLNTMWSLPTALHFENFIAAYKQLAPNLGNSFIMVIPEAILSSLLGSLNGY